MSRSPLGHFRRMPLLLCVIALSSCEKPATTAPQDPPTQPRTTYVVPASIDPTGTKDVSAELQRWLDSLPDSSTVQGPAGAKYRVEFGLLVKNRWGLRFAAADPLNPPMLFQTVLEPFTDSTPGKNAFYNRIRAVIKFRVGGGHVLKNWVLHGAQPNSGYDGVYIAELEAQHGLEIAGVDGMLVEDVFITETAGDFVLVNNYQEPSILLTLSRNVTLRRVKGRKASRQGIAVGGATNLLVEDSDIQDIARSAIDFEPPTEKGTIQGAIVRNSIFGQFRNAWVAGAGSAAPLVGDITLENNQIIGLLPRMAIHGWFTTGDQPTGNRRFNVRVINNRAHSITALAPGGPWTVMIFHGIDGLEVRGNVIEWPGQPQLAAGVWFDESCGVTYSGNNWGNAEFDHRVTVGYDSMLVEIASPGAAMNATSVPVVAISAPIRKAQTIWYEGYLPTGNRRHFSTSDEAPAGATSLPVSPLKSDFNAGERSTYRQPVTENDGANLEWFRCGN